MQESEPDELEQLADAVLTASRVLVSIAAASLAGVTDELTLPQYRSLVVLHGRGPQTLQALATELQVTPSTASRMCDRLVTKGLIDRRVPAESRREVRLSLTTAGRGVVTSVTRRRRAQIRRIVGRMRPRQRSALISALSDFAEAAGETETDDRWFLGWS
jgi:DNA-binding MarR family transcriptional regulator